MTHYCIRVRGKTVFHERSGSEEGETNDEGFRFFLPPRSRCQQASRRWYFILPWKALENCVGGSMSCCSQNGYIAWLQNEIWISRLLQNVQTRTEDNSITIDRWKGKMFSATIPLMKYLIFTNDMTFESTLSKDLCSCFAFPSAPHTTIIFYLLRNSSRNHIE